MYIKYTDDLSAEGFIKLLAAEPVELSYEKTIDQRNDILKAARSWVSKNLRDPAYQ